MDSGRALQVSDEENRECKTTRAKSKESWKDWKRQFLRATRANPIGIYFTPSVQHYIDDHKVPVYII